MTENLGSGTFRAARRRAALLAVFTLALAGCGSTAATKKPASHPLAPRPLALTPPHRASPRATSARRRESARGTVASKPASVASGPCPVGEKRTATELCYSPAAQTKLVKTLGPCPTGQVVADNGACQPLSSRRPIHPPSLPGGGTRNARGPAYDTVFH
ncbi:MAG: hypothetical protein M3Z06_15140 [Actinomycetota bacterium]|nr:hypothetical protein [Actinomycetota bacterium]